MIPMALSRVQPNKKLVVKAIKECQIFRKIYGSFDYPLTVSCRYKLDDSKCKIIYYKSLSTLHFLFYFHVYITIEW